MDDGMYLVTQTGEFVLGADGEAIRLPEGGIRVAEDGTIFSSNEQVGKLGLFWFVNPNGLSKAGETRFAETEASGPAQAIEGAVMQGSLEQSNVSLADELTMLIRSQRAYALMSRALSTTDNMMGLANTMHG
jgi:flagellar basal-body rod protein FlgG